MRRIRLVVAYDGTNYCGWQIQPNGITIEEVLNKALCKLTGEEIRIIGASRTDSGVHALGNVAVFDTESSIPAERIAYALNQRLPEDIVVVKSEEVPCDWHPRYQSKVTKTYEYRIYNDQTKNPLRRQYTAFVSFPMDIEKMRDEYDGRRRYLVEGLRRIGLPCFEPKGAFYVFPDIRGTGLTSDEFCERFLMEEKVAVISGAAFGPGGEGFIRCCYATSMKDIAEALTRMDNFLTNLRKKQAREG